MNMNLLEEIPLFLLSFLFITFHIFLTLIPASVHFLISFHSLNSLRLGQCALIYLQILSVLAFLFWYSWYNFSGNYLLKEKASVNDYFLIFILLHTRTNVYDILSSISYKLIHATLWVIVLGLQIVFLSFSSMLIKFVYIVIYVLIGVN